MRQVTIIFLLFFISISSSFSQLGSDCLNANVVTSLPYIATGLTTVGSGNDFDNSSCCGSVYMSGEDYVFSFTPTTNIPINVILSNTGVGTGVFITDKCPDDPTANCVAMNEAQNGNPQLNGIQLFQDSTYYIIVSTYNLFNLNLNTVFDIQIRESFPLDVGVFSFHNRSDCDLGTNVPVTIQIKNYGYDTISNFPVAYEINGGAAVNETFIDTLLPLEVKYFTFTTLTDMSTSGVTYDIISYTLFGTDGDLSNDSLITHITHSVYSNIPYYEDFESGQGGWVTDRINASQSLSSWQYGMPNAVIIDSAASTSNAWVTNLTGNNNPFEKSFVLSPCFDFSSLIMPIFEFNIWYETEASDYIVLAYSLDNGYTWITIGSVNDNNNWYNGTVGGYDGWNGSSGGWVNAKHLLNTLAGVSKVQFRIYFEGGVNGINEGFAFDDVKIYESPLNDLSIVDIVSPKDGCDLLPNEDITIKITNIGLYDQNNFDLSYSVDGGTTFVTEIFTDTIFSQDTLVYTFLSTSDLSTSGLYVITATTGLVNDENIQNDTLSKFIYHFTTINTFPYKEDFETDDGAWYTIGNLSSWEHGIPTDSVIDHAASGNNAWVTNLSGVPNLGEISFLYTPCFNLSNLTKPRVNFNIWYDVDPIGTKFEYSIDGGQTWNNYGDTLGNWYNQGYNWIHQSNGWVNVERDLYGFAGISQIQFRFNFTGTNLYSGFAVDDFTICDEPTSSFSYQTNGLEISFTDESVSSNTYYWDFGDSTSSTLQNPVHIYNYPDTFTVMLIVYSDCGIDTSFQNISIVGIEQIRLHKFNIFPNPASDELFINSASNDKRVKFEIINQQGNTILNGYFRNNKKLKLETLNKGLYYLKLCVGDNVIVRKLIII